MVVLEDSCDFIDMNSLLGEIYPKNVGLYLNHVQIQPTSQVFRLDYGVVSR